MDKLISTSEAAEIADTTHQSIGRACRRGTLKAEKVGRNWVIKLSDLHTWMASKPVGGRPLN